jgi:nicotinamide-nucleotide amidase
MSVSEQRPARAGIVVTGTEVLTGRVRDRNGPWLSERLFEQGFDLAHILIVGDRPRDMESALRFMATEGMDVVLTSGGLGPTADDLTAEVVGRFQGREMVLDAALQGRIAEILRPLAERYPSLDHDAIAAGNRKQATIPSGASVLEPVGTAPGLVVTPAAGRDGPTVVVLPGPPRELQPMWRAATATPAWRDALAQAREYRQGMLRLFGIPESEIAETLRQAERSGADLAKLEITTCLRGGEIEIVTRYEPGAEAVYKQFEAIVAERHADTLYSTDGTTVDDQVAALLLRGTGRTIAVAESCTGGLLAARLTNPPGASEYVLGGIVAYSDELKVEQVGVSRATIERHGAVSEQVVRELAAGARTRLGADLGVGVTGIAGPGGGSEEKPVGLVWLSVQAADGAGLTRSVHLPGGRADVRERAVTVAMHMIRRLLRGERDEEPGEGRDGVQAGERSAAGRAGPLPR